MLLFKNQVASSPGFSLLGIPISYEIIHFAAKYRGSFRSNWASILRNRRIARTFDGRELNTEYLFGLSANLATSPAFSLLGIPISYEITHFAASQNIAAASTRTGPQVLIYAFTQERCHLFGSPDDRMIMRKMVL